MSNNKQSMKLYSEEEVRKALKMALGPLKISTENYFINSLTPIEFPSDEEISKEVTDLFGKTTKIYISIIQCKAFEQGAIWMRDKIQGGNNDQQ